MKWKKSSYSAHNGNCLSCATVPGGMLVRDSKNPDGGVLHFTAAEWRVFIDGLKAGAT